MAAASEFNFKRTLAANIEGYSGPDLTNASAAELWRHWSSFPRLMREMEAHGTISVSYGGGPFVPFVPSQDNFHQALALACFMYNNPMGDAWVRGPHAHGGQFSAYFRKSSNNTVTYTTPDLRTVCFAFAEGL
jgi:hypothetical protein